jgi:hypothetical protein
VLGGPLWPAPIAVERKWPFKGLLAGTGQTTKIFIALPTDYFPILGRFSVPTGSRTGFPEIADLARRTCMHFCPLPDCVRRIEAEEDKAAQMLRAVVARRSIEPTG